MLQSASVVPSHVSQEIMHLDETAGVAQVLKVICYTETAGAQECKGDGAGQSYFAS